MIQGTGAYESKKDNRTIIHSDTVKETTPNLKGGVDYLPEDIEMQAKVGICTAISLTQNAAKALGRKFSADFQYLLQKLEYDGNWDEGSSILSALTIAHKYGFLPIEEWTYTTQQDREVSYETYIKKLINIPSSEIERLKKLCINKITYASVGVDVTSIANAIDSSKSGILCMYRVGDTYYTSPTGKISWNPVDIDPIRIPKTYTSGHAITMSKYDWTNEQKSVLANTWSSAWDINGCANIYFTYKPVECWIPYYNIDILFSKDLFFGMSDPDVKLLQQTLNKLGFTVATTGAGSIGKETNYFGTLTRNAVKLFQKAHNIPQTGYVGTLTRGVLNHQ